RDRRHGWNVEHVESRVAERLAEKESRTGPDSAPPVVEVSGIDESRLDAEALERIAEEVVRAAIERSRGNDVVARAHERRHREVQCRLAGSSSDRADAALERRHPLLEHRYRRVGDARVDV